MNNEGGSWAQYQKLVLRLLEQHDEKLEELTTKLHDSQSDRSAIHVLIDNLQKDSELLKGLIREGTIAQPAIIDRIQKLEYKFEELIEQAKIQTDTLKEQTNYKRALIIAIIVPVLTIIWELVKTFFIH